MLPAPATPIGQPIPEATSKDRIGACDCAHPWKNCCSGGQSEANACKRVERVAKTSPEAVDTESLHHSDWGLQRFAQRQIQVVRINPPKNIRLPMASIDTCLEPSNLPVEAQSLLTEIQREIP